MKKLNEENLDVTGKGIFKSQLFKLSNGKDVESPFPISTYIGILLLVISLIAVVITKVDIFILFENGKNFFELPLRMFPIEWSFYSKSIGPMIDTIQMSILGSFVGSVFALPVAFLASSNINKLNVTLFYIGEKRISFNPLLGITRFVLTIFRTLPVLVYASIFTVIFGFGTFAGTISIMLFTFSIVSKILYERIETIDLGPYEALLATGSDKLKAIRVAIVPQILPSFLSTSLYSFEINIRYAAILGYVGAGGIGLLINEKLGWRQYGKFGMIFVLLLIVVLSVESLSRYLRGRLE